MAEAFITRRGRTATSDFSNLTSITVQHPNDAICTCSKDGVILNSNSTNTTSLFIVTQAGTWTISCTFKNKTLTEQVEVELNKNYVVEFVFAQTKILVYEKQITSASDLVYIDSAIQNSSSQDMTMAKKSTNNDHDIFAAWKISNIEYYSQIQAWVTYSSKIDTVKSCLTCGTQEQYNNYDFDNMYIVEKAGTTDVQYFNIKIPQDISGEYYITFSMIINGTKQSSNSQVTLWALALT